MPVSIKSAETVVQDKAGVVKRWRACAVWVVAVMLGVSTIAHADPPTSYREAKELLREQVYHDQGRADFGTVYCGCSWRWKGESGGRVVYDDSCPATISSYENREHRTEWEHIVPISQAAGDWPCWDDGGRDHCADHDPRFQRMYADPHNLTVSIGSINAQRLNHPYGMVAANEGDFGACTSSFDEHADRFEPRDEAKGFVARVTFYMADRYGLVDEILPSNLERVLVQWDRRHPPTDWERLRARRIEKATGVANPYALGERQWDVGDQARSNGFDGISGRYQQEDTSEAVDPSGKKPVIGNKNSDIYHLDHCPSYGRVHEKNRQYFESEKAARKAGFRKAGNC